MEAIELISQDLFDKIRSRFSNLEMGDELGNVTKDPQKARFFDFDFVLEGANLGRISISINQRGNLKIFYGKGLLEDHDAFVQHQWFKFLKEMRKFAKRRRLRFDTRDITKSNLSKEDFQFLASTGTKENTMSESRLFGSSKTSYRPLEKTRLILRHRKPVDDSVRGARSRNIEAIFVENADGERFKFPFIDLSGAKAMQRHCANGGRPHDDHGKEIISMSEERAKLRAFRNKVGKHDSMQSEANEILNRTESRLEAVKHELNSISTQSGYEGWKARFKPTGADELIVDAATLETYKNTFTINSFNEELSEYFPLIHKVMQETSEVDLEEYIGEVHEEQTCKECGMYESKCECEVNEEANFQKFVEWMDKVSEMHLTDDQINGLKELLDQNIDSGVDGLNAIESLKGIGIQDDDLENMIQDAGPDGDLKTIVTMWLSQNDDTDAIEKLGLDSSQEQSATSEEPPAEEMPAEEPPTEEMPPEEPSPTPAAGQPTESTAEEVARNPVKVKRPTEEDVQEMIKSFYNRENNTFPLGEEGVITKVTKTYGEDYRELAEEIIEQLTSERTFEDILRLSGLKK